MTRWNASVASAQLQTRKDNLVAELMSEHESAHAFVPGFSVVGGVVLPTEGTLPPDVLPGALFNVDVADAGGAAGLDWGTSNCSERATERRWVMRRPPARWPENIQ